jgi:hypothetical protein
MCDEVGLETFFLKGASLKYATREGAAVRIRKKGTYAPTLDIFFVKENEKGELQKVHSWDGDKLTTGAKETWPTKSHVFPLRITDVDGMEWPLPNKGEELLTIQYGDGWNKEIKSPKPLTASHKWAFWYTNRVLHVWSVRKPGSPQTASQWQSSPPQAVAA